MVLRTQTENRYGAFLREMNVQFPDIEIGPYGILLVEPTAPQVTMIGVGDLNSGAYAGPHQGMPIPGIPDAHCVLASCEDLNAHNVWVYQATIAGAGVNAENDTVSISNASGESGVLHRSRLGDVGLGPDVYSKQFQRVLLNDRGTLMLHCALSDETYALVIRDTNATFRTVVRSGYPLDPDDAESPLAGKIPASETMFGQDDQVVFGLNELTSQMRKHLCLYDGAWLHVLAERETTPAWLPDGCSISVIRAPLALIGEGALFLVSCTGDGVASTNDAFLVYGDRSGCEVVAREGDTFTFNGGAESAVWQVLDYDKVFPQPVKRGTWRVDADGAYLANVFLRLDETPTYSRALVSVGLRYAI